MDTSPKRSIFETVGIALFITAIIAGLWYAHSTRTISAGYLLDNALYPSLYPLSEATYSWNFLGGIMVVATGLFMSALLFAVSKIIETLKKFLPETETPNDEVSQ